MNELVLHHFILEPYTLLGPDQSTFAGCKPQGTPTILFKLHLVSFLLC